jgi:hypothetical protein
MKKPSLKLLGRMAAGIAVASVVAMPVVASAATANSSVEATVASVLTVSSSSTVPISVTPTGPGAVASANDTVTVDTNNSTGYDLTLQDSDTTYTMTGYLAADGVTPNSDSLAKHTGTYGSPSALDANSWGWRVDSLGSFGAGGTTTYAGVPANGSAQNIKSTSSTATSDVTTVKYAVKVDTSKKSGIYKDTVTYTATAKP